ncbi:hypothetical protein D3C72_1963920 [compost metagenome]
MGGTAAFEAADDTDAFGMIAPKALVDAAVGFQGVHHAVGGQALRVEPAAYVGERGTGGEHDGADCGEAKKGLRGGERPGLLGPVFR